MAKKTSQGLSKIKSLVLATENQIFDRKSFLIETKSLANIIVAFANADGGDVAIGIEDDGRITGINHNQKHLNELLRVPFDYCVPSVEVETEFINCRDFQNKENRILLMHVLQSADLHTNQADECFYRVGDKSKKINPKIAQFMHEYELVKEFGEGVDRMFREMEAAGNPAPEYKQYDFVLKAKLVSSCDENRKAGGQTGGQTAGNDTTIAILKAIAKDPSISRVRLSELVGVSPSAVQKHINKLKKQKIIVRNGGDFGGCWKILNKSKSTN